MKTIKINGKNVKLPEIDFGVYAFMQDHGTSLDSSESFKKKPFPLMRNFVSVALHIDTDEADYLLNQHILAGGEFTPLLEEIGEAIESSDFLKKMSEPNKKTKANVDNVNEEKATIQ